MANLFFRTSIAPYRVDTYNTIHRILDCEMYFMSRSDDSQDFQVEKIDSRCEFRPHILSKKKIFGFPYYKNIWKILRDSNPDIVIVPEFKFLTIQVLAYKWLANRHIKVISMCDDSLDMVENGKDFTFIHTIARKVVVPFLDDLILVNDKVRDWYQRRYKKGIWMPIIRDEQIELPLYKSALGIAKEFETKFNLQNQKILLYVGRLVDVKNIPTLIKAIDLTKAEFTTVIVGDGPLKEDLELLANQTEKKILFVGRFDDEYVRAWFDLADVFILPSTTEAFGAVTNEALLGGCYTLLSKACGSTCLIDPNNGRLFDPESPEQLAVIIDETFNNIPKEGSKSNNLMNLTFQNAVVNVIKQLKR